MGKVSKATMTYKCGHEWTSEYARPQAQSTIKREQYFAAQKPCPKCEDSKEDRNEGLG